MNLCIFLIKGLGIFNIIWSIILFFLFLGSQFQFLCGSLMGVFYIISGSGIFSMKLKARQRYIKWVIPLSILGILNLIIFTKLGTSNGFHMTAESVLRFTKIYILFPIIVNFLILFFPKVKEQFK